MGRSFIALFLALLLVTRPVLAAGLPVVVSNSVSTVTQNKMVALGVSPQDPRYLSTLNGMTSIAGTALMVGSALATAPAWVSVAVAAGISALVGTVVSLGVSSLWNWAFGSPSSATPVTVNAPAGSAQPAIR